MRDFVDAVVQSPELPLLPGDAMSGLQKAFTVTGDTYEAIARWESTGTQTRSLAKAIAVKFKRRALALML